MKNFISLIEKKSMQRLQRNLAAPIKKAQAKGVDVFCVSKAILIGSHLSAIVWHKTTIVTATNNEKRGSIVHTKERGDRAKNLEAMLCLLCCCCFWSASDSLSHKTGSHECIDSLTRLNCTTIFTEFFFC